MAGCSGALVKVARERPLSSESEPGGTYTVVSQRDVRLSGALVLYRMVGRPE